jgi:hypothetical protein
MYQLEQGDEMRMRLIRLYQQVELLSGKILKQQSGMAAATAAATADQRITDMFKLQRNIRVYAIGFLKEYSFSLPTLPSTNIDMYTFLKLLLKPLSN